MSLEERLEKAEKLVAEVKAELAAMRVTKRNWPERIEAGMCFRHEPTQMVVLWTHERMEDCVVLARGGGIGDAIKKEYLRVYRNCEYLGHARDILTIRTDAREPTGAELVGVLEDIRNVSNNPGRTLLGLAECLQSCNVMARNALEGLAK